MATMTYPRFLAEAAGILAGLMAVGYLPTVKLAGREAVPAMLAGCAVGLVASIAGALPILKVRRRDPRETLPAVLGSITLRFAAAVALAAAAAMSGWLAVKPFLVWVAISYVGLLATDVRFARASLAA